MLTGDSLTKAVLSTKYKLPEDIAGEMRQLLCAVAYLHLIHVLHGDISPSNVVLENDNARLIGFGTAEIFNDDQVSTCPIRTMPYFAPERKKHQSCFASDVYSLGMTFAYLRGHYIGAFAVGRYAENEAFKSHALEPHLTDLPSGMTRPASHDFS